MSFFLFYSFAIITKVGFLTHQPALWIFIQNCPWLLYQMVFNYRGEHVVLSGEKNVRLGSCYDIVKKCHKGCQISKFYHKIRIRLLFNYLIKKPWLEITILSKDLYIFVFLYSFHMDIGHNIWDDLPFFLISLLIF